MDIPTHSGEAQQWAQTHLGNVGLGGIRRMRRVVKLSAGWAPEVPMAGEEGESNGWAVPACRSKARQDLPYSLLVEAAQPAPAGKQQA